MSYQIKTTTAMKKKSHIEVVRESFLKEFALNKYNRELKEAEEKQAPVLYYTVRETKEVYVTGLS